MEPPSQLREDLLSRTKAFALSAIRLCRHLPQGEESRVIGRQLLRSATSVAANYRAACRARTRAVFVAKLDTVVEEADESAFWLELLEEAENIPSSQIAPLLDEAHQLTRIFSAARATARKKATKKVTRD